MLKAAIYCSCCFDVDISVWLLVADSLLRRKMTLFGSLL